MKKIFVLLLCGILTSCATAQVKAEYQKKIKHEEKRHQQAIDEIEKNKQEKVALESIAIYKSYLLQKAKCGDNNQCQQKAGHEFVNILQTTYISSDVEFVLRLCHQKCSSPRQLEYLVAMNHNNKIENNLKKLVTDEQDSYKRNVKEIESWFNKEYALARIRDQQAARAFAAGMQSYATAMQQQQYYNNQYSTGYSGYSQPSYGYNPPSYGYNPSYVWSNNFGSNMTFYSGDISGTSQRIGSFVYHNFNNGLSGTSQRIGNFTYYNMNTGLSGTSQQIGSFTYHSFNSGISGTTQSIGSFDYTNFSDGTHCTSQNIGSSTYTNCN